MELMHLRCVLQWNEDVIWKYHMMCLMINCDPPHRPQRRQRRQYYKPINTKRYSNMDICIFTWICSTWLDVEIRLLSTNLKLQHKLLPINTVRVWNSVFNFQKLKGSKCFFSSRAPRELGLIHSFYWKLL